jgi:hypothetical protein
MHLSIPGLPDCVQCAGSSLLAASSDETGCVTWPTSRLTENRERTLIDHDLGNENVLSASARVERRGQRDVVGA